MSIFNSENLILKRLKKADTDAFTEAYNLYVDKIYRFIYFKIGNEDEAKDLTSAVFLKSWNHVQENSVKNYKSLRALLYTVARNLVIDHYRRNNVRAGDVSLDSSYETVELAGDNNIENQLDFKIDKEKIEKKLFELKDEYREILVMRFIEELSITEIAQILDKPNGNIRVTIHRALKTLREIMEA